MDSNTSFKARKGALTIRRPDLLTLLRIVDRGDSTLKRRIFLFAENLKL
jgi:hypothetical protein